MDFLETIIKEYVSFRERVRLRQAPFDESSRLLSDSYDGFSTYLHDKEETKLLCDGKIECVCIYEVQRVVAYDKNYGEYDSFSLEICIDLNFIDNKGNEKDPDDMDYFSICVTVYNRADESYYYIVKLIGSKDGYEIYNSITTHDREVIEHVLSLSMHPSMFVYSNSFDPVKIKRKVDEVMINLGYVDNYDYADPDCETSLWDLNS